MWPHDQRSTGRRALTLHAPETLEEAADLLARHHGNVRLGAGCTYVMLMAAHGEVQPEHLVGLHRIPGLDQLEPGRVGALTTLRHLERGPRTGAERALTMAAAVTAGPLVRTLGTVGRQRRVRRRGRGAGADGARRRGPLLRRDRDARGPLRRGPSARPHPDRVHLRRDAGLGCHGEAVPAGHGLARGHGVGGRAPRRRRRHGHPRPGGRPGPGRDARAPARRRRRARRTARARPRPSSTPPSRPPTASTCAATPRPPRPTAVASRRPSSPGR